MGLSWIHILVVAVLVFMLFGRGRFSDIMGDVAKGIKSFKSGLSDDEKEVEAKREQARDYKTIDATAETESVLRDKDRVAK